MDKAKLIKKYTQHRRLNKVFWPKIRRICEFWPKISRI